MVLPEVVPEALDGGGMVGKPLMPGSRDIDASRLGDQIEALPAIAELREIAERAPA
jgi:hypothetical protein